MLLGDKIILRAVLRTDLPVFQEMYKVPEIIRFLDSRGDISLGAFEAKLTAKHDSKERRGEWLAIEGPDNKVVGSITYNSKWGAAEVSIENLYIGTEYQNAGYATDAIKRITKYLFEEKEKRRLEVLIREDNFAAIKAFEKAGYVKEGTRRASAFSKGRYLNEVFMSKLTRETLI
jgi:RimJ/RimL family protein N-acetyltransferase